MEKTTSAITAAERLLVRREHSAKELAQKLKQRGFDDDEIADTIVTLQNNNLQSDDRFAEMWVHSRQSRGFGPISIAEGLKQRGVSQALIEKHLMIDKQAWVAIASDARKKRFGETIPADYPSRSKQMRFLQQRGFSSEQINIVVKHEDE